ncbi:MULTISPECIES: DNA polymerase III subunit gamma/tau [Lysinibacillus]|uniref:DNA-directed DNA polymerase n=1 Tax=Lysinibacillus fusiformis TaxID=28031 RepID=A0A1H9SLQ0_9BACI|nr:DNA polymerase III subunit gamma/tau [Lysinibacillus fusiformis]MCG7437775.1 DNA polymerase III subunit gamma/tau [Lysinibacillus fusiformis]SCX69768.1 DNA polymerase-3 subunit gamma/tau [Lysinibacillus fusiformis]SCY84700.1 DNA polymerase-3 subunit gamma/tau [Lysinibacillus fusiformis]SDB58839.1 DNA polymerase-3 subunit gamma/tau [Lysinibacillus fusiformis]SEO57532.1 DNA polymerase-3 subunit gamma/tau [Lysinibacillus fusiformis]
MTYQAFYRVYRPQSFREMSGQAHVKRTLQNALLANKTTHAYLFSGPRGTGKTSTAKIFAKALNCEHAPAKEPCNECATCISITDGSHPDVIEFDAASNSRVEEIRDIIEKVRFAPASSRYKVYIIDEVHMLSTSAFNALLKTLEEPPPHAVFILATTEPHKLPATIISRCQRFDFKRLSTNDIIERMKVVLEDIELPYEEQGLKVIAQSAAGGMRDALSLLDQVVSFSGEKLKLEDTLLVTGSISQDVFYDLAEALKAKDVAQMLALLEQLIVDGKDPLRLSEDLITFFRDLLLLQTSDDLAELLELVSPEERVLSLAHEFAPNMLYGYIDILAKTQQEMRFSHHTKIYLETALLKMVQFSGGSTNQAVTTTSDTAINPELAQKIVALEQMVQQLSVQLQSGASVQASQTPKEQRPRAKNPNGYKAPTGRIQEVLKDATKQDVQRIKSVWAQALNQLQKSQSALLAEAEPVAASSSAFVLKFKYDIHCQMVADNQSLKGHFTQLIAGQTGTMYEMLCIPEESWLKMREEFIRDHSMQHKKTSAASENGEELLEPPPAEMSDEPFIDDAQPLASQDPLVTEAENLFGKDFVEIMED